MSVQEFLKQRAVRVSVGGDYTLANWFDPQGKPRTFACRTTRVSPFRMTVEVPVVGKVGDQFASYFRDFGKFEGRITDKTSNSLLVELEMDRAQREQLANKLTWLENKLKNPQMPDARRAPRVIPASPHSTLALADGSIHKCFVIDMSASGVAVSAELQPSIGTPLAVGACIGRVVRLLPNGFAVEFLELQNPNNLDRLIIRPISPAPHKSKSSKQ